MPVINEFRIPLPLSVDEFHRGQLYMTAKAELEAATASGKEGVVVLKNEPYDNTDGHLGTCPITGALIPRDKGQYTMKHYVFASKVPTVLKAIAPASALYLIECAWNGFPHCKTVLVSGYLSKDTLKIDVETMHIANDMNLPNAVGLTDAELSVRKVEVVDIRSTAKTDSPDYSPELDPSKFKSKKTGRGELKPGWAEQEDKRIKAGGETSTAPFMTCYKVVRAHCSLFGLASTVENAILGQQRGLFATTHNKAFITIDEWIDATMDDIRKLEAETAEKVVALLGENAKVDTSLKR